MKVISSLLLRQTQTLWYVLRVIVQCTRKSTDEYHCFTKTTPSVLVTLTPMGLTAMGLTVTCMIVLLVGTQALAQRLLSLHVIFTGPPGDIEEGTTARMECSIIIASPNLILDPIINLQVLHNGIEIINKERISGRTTYQSTEYDLTVDRSDFNTFVVNLDVLDVRRDDAGTYTCKVSHLLNLNGSAIATDEATTQINITSADHQPYCHVLGRPLPDEIPSGTVVTLLCSFKTRDPTVVLNWSQPEGTELIFEAQIQNNGYTQNELTVRLLFSSDEADVVFRCEVRKADVPSFRSNCNVGPLNIAPVIDTDISTMSGSGPLAKTSAPDIYFTEENNQASITVKPGQLPGNDTKTLAAIIVLAGLLVISILFNIFSIVRRRGTRQPHTTQTVYQNGDYQGLNRVEQNETYTRLNSPPVSLQTIQKKPEAIGAVHQHSSDEDYAQVEMSSNG
ncbi:uncharacterized protein LOC110982987 [Acanthaster planci]|uniref:Uncharacterized protein LOC110982987 n=1 Tax=Acanthaster planci TaxID=133434 RepID=A0A8B7Z2A4_ACAPL|nr:uncharacterized protein LOC110982987 [Acanthaster planci]